MQKYMKIVKTLTSIQVQSLVDMASFSGGQYF